MVVTKEKLALHLANWLSANTNCYYREEGETTVDVGGKVDCLLLAECLLADLTYDEKQLRESLESQRMWRNN